MKGNNMKLKNTILCSLLAGALMLTGCSNEKDTGSNAETTESSQTNSSQSDDTQASSSAVGNIGDVQLQNGDLIATFNIEGYGEIKAKLYPDIAPVGVDNFVKLADSGYYEGLTIHRVYAGFMFQGGSLNGDGTGGEAADGGSFGVEANENMRHFYGALCYANAAGKNSTQFYIVNNKQSEDITKYDIGAIKEDAGIYALYRDMYEEGSIEYDYYNANAKHYENLSKWLEDADSDVIAKYKEVGGTPSLDGGYTVFGQVYEGFDVIDSISACEVVANAQGEVSQPVQTITINSVTITEYSAE